jgi:mannan endo-1,4-beta-mannosidase
MKLLTLLGLGTAVVALPAAVDLAPRAAISKVDGLKFNIDGITKYYAGTNSYWIPFLTNDNDVDTIMGHLATSGQKILRIWGFNDVNTIPGSGTVYFQSFSGSTATINTGANGLKRLDAVVKSAEKHGIKLIINFVNNWTDYGYVSPYIITHSFAITNF